MAIVERICRFCRHHWQHEIGGFCPACHRFQVPVSEIKAVERDLGIRYHAAQGQSGAYRFVTTNGAEDVSVPHADERWSFDAPHKLVELDALPEMPGFIDDDRQILRLVQAHGVISAKLDLAEIREIPAWGSLRDVVRAAAKMARAGDI